MCVLGLSGGDFNFVLSGALARNRRVLREQYCVYTCQGQYLNSMFKFVTHRFLRCLSVGGVFLVAAVHAEDLVIMQAPTDAQDRLQDYTYAVVLRALRETEGDYGRFRLRETAHAMVRDRQFSALHKGKDLTVLTSPPKRQWSKKVIRVPFPIQRGISSYRIFMLMEEHKELLKNVHTLAQLKAVSTGSSSDWSTTQILADHGFNLVVGYGYATMFDMLAQGRFQTFNRGVNEIPIELEIFSRKHKQLAYDRYVAVYTYLPNYFYVSPQHKRLAHRIEAGLIKMHKNGALDELFTAHYGNLVNGFDLKNRRIFYIENTNLEPGMYAQDKQYLLGFQQKPEVVLESRPAKRQE